MAFLFLCYKIFVMNVNAESEADLTQAEVSEKTGISMFFGIRLPLSIRLFTAFLGLCQHGGDFLYRIILAVVKADDKPVFLR